MLKNHELQHESKIPTEQPNVINKLLNVVAPTPKLSTDGTALDCAEGSRGSGIGATSEALLSEVHNSIMCQWEKDFGSIHNEQTMDAYTISGFIRAAIKNGLTKKEDQDNKVDSFLTKEVRFTFGDDSYYIVRPNGIGDTACGDGGHKIMRAINRKEMANGSSVYRFSSGDKVEFIEKFAEEILQNKGRWSDDWEE